MNKNWGNYLDRLIALFTLITVIAASITLYYFYQQTDSITKQTKLQEIGLNRQILKDSINEMRRDSASNVFFKSQKVRDSLASKQFEIQTRAYLIAALDSVFFLQGDSILTIWSFRNFGLTPAFNFRHVIIYSLMEITSERFREATAGVIKYSIGSGEPKIQPSCKGLRIMGLDCKSIAEGKRSLYVGVKTLYNDVHGRLHHSYSHVQLIGYGQFFKPKPPDD